MPDEVYGTENRLHMHRYYGTLQWQVFAIFVAAATLLATLPFVVSNDRLMHTSFFGYFVFNEIFSGLFLCVGLGFLKRNQILAHRWVHWDNEAYVFSPQYWIDIIEQGGPRPDRPPAASIFTGRLYLAIAALVSFAYILVSAFFLLIR